MNKSINTKDLIFADASCSSFKEIPDFHRNVSLETVRKLLGNIPSREEIDPKKEAEAKRRKEIVDALYKNEIRGRWEQALG